jgi:hypothetical protein
MAKKKTPGQLRAEAKKLMEQAGELENQQYEKIGRIVKGHHDANFDSFDLNSFKTEVEKILNR